MPQGLQVFDENGNTILDTNDKVARFHGSVNIGSAAGSITVNSLTQGDVFYIVMCSSPSFWDRPIFSLSGNTISWTESSSGFSGQTVLYYGTY